MHDFRKLDVWAKAHTLAKHVYAITAKMRGWQNAILRDQLFRAALSIPTNTVEGRSLGTDRQFAKYLRIALASAMEVEYEIRFANEVGAMTDADFLALNHQVVEVKKMLTSLIKRLSETSSRS